MFCQYCGASVSDTAKYCPVCGKRREAARPAAPVCPFCGAAQEADAVFCDACGKPLAGAASPGGAAKPASVPPVPSAPSYGTVRATASGETAARRKKSATPFLIVVIIVLAAAIGFLVWRQFGGGAGEPGGDAAVTETTAPRSAQSVFARNTPAPAAEETAATEVTPEPTAESEAAAAPDITPEPAPEATPALRYDPVVYETFTTPTLEDYLWADPDIMRGILPAGAERLTNFEEVEGGWKMYIIDDPYDEYGSDVERFCRCAIGEDANGKGIGIRWDYVFEYFEGPGVEDDTPDTFFYGTWEDGCLDALGPGRVTITDFWYLDEHEYAVGTMIWTDGTPAAVFLVRP